MLRVAACPRQPPKGRRQLDETNTPLGCITRTIVLVDRDYKHRLMNKNHKVVSFISNSTVFHAQCLHVTSPHFLWVFSYSELWTRQCTIGILAGLWWVRFRFSLPLSWSGRLIFAAMLTIVTIVALWKCFRCSSLAWRYPGYIHGRFACSRSSFAGIGQVQEFSDRSNCAVVSLHRPAFFVVSSL